MTLTDAQVEPMVVAQKIPERIGPYRVLRKLGEGGMGLVVEAVQEELGRPVALKLLKPELARDREFVDRFLREARSGSSISHPNVITIYDAGHDGEQLYMACQLVRGGDLSQLLFGRPDGVLTEHKALSILIDCCKGLQALHQAGLVHRDIKPGNIFLGDKGEVYIGDLGLARHAGADGSDRMTMTGTAVGTPAYMSPEHIQGISDLDIRTDVYALGATLFRCVTGREPFPGDTLFVVTHKILTEPLTDPRRLNTSLSAATAAIIKKAMAKAREERYAEPRDLQADLERARDGRPLLGAFIERAASLQVVNDVSDLAPKVHPPALKRGGGGGGGGLLSWWGAIPPGLRRLGLISLMVISSGIGVAKLPDLLQSPGGGAAANDQDPAPPGWARETGKDQYGHYAILALPGAGELRLRWCPPGSFTMGSPPDEVGRTADEPQREVTITRGFWIAATEVTQAHLAHMLGAAAPASRFLPQGSEPPTAAELPADSMTWDEAERFCKDLGRTMKGLYARLPTEAEWEYACRAGSSAPFAPALVGQTEGVWAVGDLAAAYPPPGEPIDDAAQTAIDAVLINRIGQPGYRTRRVGEGSPNRWGLHDLHGNLAEWCADAVDFDQLPGTDPVTDPWSRTGKARVLRGGSWSEPEDRCRSAARALVDRDTVHASIGFRFVVVVE